MNSILPANKASFWQIFSTVGTAGKHYLRHGIRRGVKRSLDLIAGTFLLLFLSPILIVAALTIWIFDGRPILFAGARVGKDGHLFNMMKFRTMRRDAEAIAKEIEAHKIKESAASFDKPDDESVLKLRHALRKLSPSDKYHSDPRILPFGGFMRRFSIDELPQFFHILNGDMSLVGPRPLAAWEVADFTPRDMLRHKIRPGLTGPWQISDRKSLTHDQAIGLDLSYIAEQSLWLDIKLLILTVPAALRNRGGN